jgi:iron complex outermembrane receptor protein
MLNPYLVNDLRIAYLLSSARLPSVELTLMINNLFNVSYEPNGFVDGNTRYYYPQAGRNFLAGVTVRF